MTQKQSKVPTKQGGRKPSVSPLNGVPTPPGFEAHPERRHNGAWKKQDTPRFKLEQMMKLNSDELKAIAADEKAPLFERKLSIAISNGDWREIKEMIQEVYGKPKESVDVTTQGESINPYNALTVQELRKLAKS